MSALLIILGVLPGTNIMERDKRFLAASVNGFVLTSGNVLSLAIMLCSPFPMHLIREL